MVHNDKCQLGTCLPLWQSLRLQKRAVRPVILRGSACSNVNSQSTTGNLLSASAYAQAPGRMRCMQCKIWESPPWGFQIRQTGQPTRGVSVSRNAQMCDNDIAQECDDNIAKPSIARTAIMWSRLCSTTQSQKMRQRGQLLQRGGSLDG